MEYKTSGAQESTTNNDENGSSSSVTINLSPETAKTPHYSNVCVKVENDITVEPSTPVNNIPRGTPKTPQPNNNSFECLEVMLCQLLFLVTLTYFTIRHIFGECWRRAKKCKKRGSPREHSVNVL